MRAGALTYVDMTGSRARRDATTPAADRPHVWRDGACVRCAMRPGWEGARYACVGRGQACSLKWCNRAVRDGADYCARHARGVRR